MSDKKFNYYDLGPRVVGKRDQYRDYQESHNKLTYNFVTDTRMKRGHNFGVIYLASSNMEDNEQMKKSNDSHKKTTDSHQDERMKKQNEEIQVILPDGRKNFGICTEKVIDTVRPKPISFEVEVQTELLPPRPQSPLIWPEKTGIDIETQIEDGDLFNFDEEVSPLVNVIISKTLEESRREVLEEEERAEIKAQTKLYEEIEKEDQRRVERLESKEKERYEQKLKQKAEKAIRIQMTKIFQRKLCSRTIAKQFLCPLRDTSVKTLEQHSIFKNPEVNAYFTTLLPEVENLAETYHRNDYVVVNKLNEMLKINRYNNNVNAHREAIIKEQQRREEEKQSIIKRKEEIEAEKVRQKEERRRRRSERVINELRKTITSELLVNKEFADDVDVIYDINGYYQKTKGVTCVGGAIGQLAMLIAYLNKLTPDFLNEERILKVLDLYFPTAHKFFMLYKAEDLEEYKTLDENIGAIEDIIKADDSQYKPILQKIISRSMQYDDMLQLIFDIASGEFGWENVKEYYKIIVDFVMDRFKDSLDNGKVQFILLDPAIDEIPLNSICVVNAEIIVKEKPVVPNVAAKKGPVKKGPVKITHETFWCEKTLLFQTVSDKLKIIAINKDFDRIFRDNALECINKLFKLEPEKEIMTPTLNEEYDKFIESLLGQLVERYHLKIVSLDVKQSDEAENEEEEKDDNEEEKA